MNILIRDLNILRFNNILTKNNNHCTHTPSVINVYYLEVSERELLVSSILFVIHA